MAIVSRFSSDGRYIPYTPTQDVGAGTVIVQGELVGVAIQDLPANRQGDLCVDGLLYFPKATGNGTGLAAGTVLYWDAGAQQATANNNGGANKYLGKSAIAAADADATVLIRFHPL